MQPGGQGVALDASDPNGFVVQKLGNMHDNTSPHQQGQGSCEASKDHCV